jgi:hypothetical protein
MSRSRNSVMAAALLALILWSATAHAQGQKGQCDCCGKYGDCCTICVLECKEKEVEVICWKCECEDFCLPGPCHLGCKVCEHPCGGDGGKAGSELNSAGHSWLGRLCDHCVPRPLIYHEECPGCPTHHCKKKLLKKVTKVKVPTYSWKVQSCCEACDKAGAFPGAEVPEGAEIPAPPPIEAADNRFRIRG